MLASLEQNAAPLDEAALARISHLACLMPKAEKLPVARSLPGGRTLEALLERRRMKPEDLASTPVSASLSGGTLATWGMVEPARSPFDGQSAARRVLQPALDEHPTALTLAVLGNPEERALLARHAVYAAWVNGSPLPVLKKKDERRPLERIALYGHRAPDGFAGLRARAEGNLLTRELTWLPPNDLTPGRYRERIRKLAKREGWEHEEYDLKRLRRMGAGAFVAVAQGSPDEDAAIVHLRRRGKGAKRTVALVGKGICFDTGGHNLKPARYMHGMHEDMNGSAVCLGILLAATRGKLPLNLDVWLAIAQNHISPRAYKQNDVVQALNGTTIEIVHTDAEGRMVLADALTLAARGKPDALLDFATLTGSMHVALGSRYSGVFANREDLAQQALAAGRASGERVCLFPMDADYDPELDSKIADVRQCTLEGDADHILAARFLGRFVGDVPWVHVDLSASSSKGGLGAVATDLTGFGVGWGMEMLAGVGKGEGRRMRDEG